MITFFMLFSKKYDLMQKNDIKIKNQYIFSVISQNIDYICKIKSKYT